MFKLLVLTLFIVFFMNYELFCQNNIKKYIDSIEANNLELISARRQLSADIIGSKIGIYPDDPQIGLDYFPVNQARLELRATHPLIFLLHICSKAGCPITRVKKPRNYIY